MPSATEALGYVSLVWGVFVIGVQAIGSYKIFRNYAAVPTKPVSPTKPKQDVPHVTILRPAKGLEPFLYECLASTFRQDYPRDRFTIYFCVSSRADAAYAVMRRLLDEFPDADARIFVEDEDPLLHGSSSGGHADRLGPNPKIRNLSRAYREAKGDIVWIADCNVWIARGAAGHMVDKLCGYTGEMPYKFTHQMPIVVDTVSSIQPGTPETRRLLAGDPGTAHDRDVSKSLLSQGGGRLEEMFMATEHAKFYGAINTVGVAPCAVGKSNMFRKSHLDMVTDSSRNPILPASVAHLPSGLDHFSAYICEDHLIGDLLWRSKIPGFKNHGLAWGNLAIQPMAGMSVAGYIARRKRWLRVRKWTVLAATLVEPGIQSLICCTSIAYGLTTVPWVHTYLGIPQTWASWASCWTGAIAFGWFMTESCLADCMPIDEHTPAFARGTARGGTERRRLGEWFLAWLGREFLAFPIWAWAVLLGTSVSWRGEKFRVKSDMTVVAWDDQADGDDVHNARRDDDNRQQNKKD
ncbi:ceramide glucosyltransferase [Apiospora phragmitis]|uniref:Ceramide glucosyltransferase n=1 Tax=Apiospora phragmitis TaxID=2905665 RepID=A0ABR1T4J4_9PEZI